MNIDSQIKNVHSKIQSEAVRQLPSGSVNNWLSQSAPQGEDQMVFNMKKALSQCPKRFEIKE